MDELDDLFLNFLLTRTSFLRRNRIACRRLCKKSITQSDVVIADGLLWLFVKRVKRLYGEEFVTPNMHLHCHLSCCINDYGPLHGFWLYAFERYNGLLGNQPNNNRAIEIQLMNRFVKDNSQLELLHMADSMHLCDIFGPAISDIAKSFTSTAATNTVLAETFVEPSKYTITVLNQDCTCVLKQIYCELFPECAAMITDNTLTVLSSAKQFSHILMNTKKLSSISDGLQAKVPYVLAKPVFPFRAITDDIRPAQIEYFIKHSFYTSSCYESHIFAAVQWPQIHPQRYAMGKPVEVWCKHVFEPTSKNHFLPVENITSRVIIASEKINQEEVLVVIPIL